MKEKSHHPNKEICLPIFKYRIEQELTLPIKIKNKNLIVNKDIMNWLKAINK